MDFYRWMRNQWDRTVGLLVALAGLIAIGVGWYGVSGAGLPSQQIPYLASGAVGGVFLLGVGATLWLSADARDEWRKLDELLEEVRGLRSDTETTSAPATNGAAPATNGAAPPRTPRVRARSTAARSEH
ncbi:MAG: hypothetical protein QOC92_2288 [Acidimicrobiaceae bacterium]